jgi:acetyl-CoA decarbonylase/synthase complex subunit gamma
MALKGLDIFKLTPKTNCKECGFAACMAFSMKVAQGAAQIEQCPHLSPEALASLSEATAPPMKTIQFGKGDATYSVGGEMVLFRHEKTFVNKSLYALDMDASTVDDVLAQSALVDFERIGEHMYAEVANVRFTGDVDAFVAAVKKADAASKAIILETTDGAAAKAALEAISGSKAIINGANKSNFEACAGLAKEYGAVLGVSGSSLDELYDTVQAIEQLEFKDIVIDVGSLSVKDAFASAVQIRRAALKDNDRSFGYPSIVNVAKLAPGNLYMQQALASLFTCKYGSIIVLEGINYPQALSLFGLRQNIFTDPQKPMTVEPGNYPVNNADENAICALTVDFALTYFIISGECERSGVPVNLLIPDAGGYSVLTAWAAGKFTAGSIAKFINEGGWNDKLKNHTLLIPGKVAVLKGELEENLPGWNIVVAPGEATGLVKFLKEFVAAA